MEAVPAKAKQGPAPAFLGAVLKIHDPAERVGKKPVQSLAMRVGGNVRGRARGPFPPVRDGLLGLLIEIRPEQPWDTTKCSQHLLDLVENGSV